MLCNFTLIKKLESNFSFIKEKLERLLENSFRRNENKNKNHDGVRENENLHILTFA